MTSSPTVRRASAPLASCDTVPGPVRRRGRLRRAVFPALVAAAWLLPLATHAVRADWFILVVARVGIAVLLRAGRLLVDRLVLAGILAGFLIAAGLLFSVWPWRFRGD